ncbi:MAG: DUF4421 domain-containing protein [Bacteroidales bacterium]|nr:DUF4421 domain-containing protein [Bacteroidales bacterium]
MNCVIKILIFLIILSSKSLVLAQDTLYKKSYGNRMIAKTFCFGDNFNISDPELGLSYVPNSHSGVGIGVWTKYFPFDIAYRHEISFDSKNKYNKISATDMQLKAYCSFFAGDIYIQKYKGFIETYNDESLNPEEEQYAPDLCVFQFGAVGHYIFNKDKYSYKAAFNANECQLQSAGSFVSGISLYCIKINSDSTLFKGNIADLKSWSIGLNAGYAYNFVFKSKFIIGLLGIVGLNGSNYDFKKIIDKKAKLAPSCNIKMSFWYNFNSWSIGITNCSNFVNQKFVQNFSINQSTSKSEIILLRRLWYKKQKNLTEY